MPDHDPQGGSLRPPADTASSAQLARIEARLEALEERLGKLNTGGGGIGCLGFGLLVIVILKLNELLERLPPL